MKFVYLAGPILHCNKDEANDWRASVSAILGKEGIVGISPLRCEPLVGDRYEVQYADERFGTARAIGSKNFFDVRKCDLILAYLPLPPAGRHQSWGTIVELAWAHAMQKPAILVSNDPAVQEHPVINACAGWTLTNLADGVDTIIGILGGYNGGKNV
jgi:nucleoside 2-deoxyribosyltransferase